MPVTGNVIIEGWGGGGGGGPRRCRGSSAGSSGAGGGGYFRKPFLLALVRQSAIQSARRDKEIRTRF